ncbi:MAG: hypothetical protein ABJH52_17155 [Henriciella sp.]
MLSSIDPKITQGLSKLKIAALVVALALSAFSLVTGVLYWSNGAGETDIAAGIFAGALPEIMVVLFFVALDLMWKQKQKGSGTFAGIVVVTVALLVSWLASSAGSFMYMTTMDERAIASSKATVSNTREATLQTDLARFNTELNAYEGVKREDVSALEDLLERCPNVPRDECITTDVQQRLATNKAINGLEEKKSETLGAIEALATTEQNTIRDSQFSLALFAAKLDFASREFLFIAYLDTLKIILFFVGLWASLRLRLLADATRGEQLDLKKHLDERFEEIIAIKAELETKLDDLGVQTLQVERLNNRAQNSAEKLQDVLKAQKSTDPTTGKPKRRKSAQKGGEDFVEYEVEGPDGEPVTKRMKIA